MNFDQLPDELIGITGMKENDKMKTVFDQYGSGIKAYFHFLKSLMYVYLAMCLMVFPVIYIYGSHNGLKGLENYFVTQFSMGNLGFAETLCYN